MEIRVGGFSSKELHYGFAEGDVILFELEERKGRSVSNVEISEYPGTIRFAERGAPRINNVSMQVHQQGVFTFKVSNGKLRRRTCRLRIFRIPAHEDLAHWNTAVVWESVPDTTYDVRQEKYLVSSDTSIVEVANQVSRVAGTLSPKGNRGRTLVEFDLPENTVAWSYYVGTEAGQATMDAAADDFAASASPVLMNLTGGDPLAMLALHGVSLFNKLSDGENVQYWVLGGAEDAGRFVRHEPFRSFRGGNVVNDFARLEEPLGGRRYIGLANDNLMVSLNVNVMVKAVVVNANYATRPVTTMSIEYRDAPRILGID
ncbi:MAG: hypothetical protein AAGI71_08845 [Bacteroidota bacterium]